MNNENIQTLRAVIRLLQDMLVREERSANALSNDSEIKIRFNAGGYYIENEVIRVKE
jgi:hypothetical protein